MSRRNAISIVIAATVGFSSLGFASTEAAAHWRRGVYHPLVVPSCGRYFPEHDWGYGHYCTYVNWDGYWPSMARYGLVPAFNGGYWIPYGGWVPPPVWGFAAANGSTANGY